MDSITISTGRQQTYRVVFGSIDDTGDWLAGLSNLASERCLLVTDSNVGDLYAERIERSIQSRIDTKVLRHTVEAGEPSKSLATFATLMDWALANNIDRKTPLIALGGGVVGDLAGFAAASLLRGLPLIHIPTTLTAQVDSAIGGKTGINHPAGKNLIGSFYPPKLVLADTTTLSTLPAREWRSGLAEVVKHAYISDADRCSRLIDNWSSIVRAETSNATWVADSAGVKARIVQEDEHESGVRMWLNFGHTTGHAIERTTAYGTFTHGEAVAFGLAVAIELSNNAGYTIDNRLAKMLLIEMNIRDRLASLDPVTIYPATATDKKNARGRTRFVLLQEPGKPYLNESISGEEFSQAWDRALDWL